MENLSNSIAEKIASELNMDNDKKEVIAYGTFALLQALISIVLTLTIGSIFNVAIEALIVLFTGSMLRKYSGGAHANSPGNCTAIGVIICIVQGILISIIVNKLGGNTAVLIAILIIFIWSYYLIYKLAPVDSPSKPIKKEEKRKRMKKGSFIILSTYLIIVIIGITLYVSFKKGSFLVYALCVCGGIAWQVFTLTRRGHLAMSKIDAFLNYITKQKKE